MLLAIDASTNWASLALLRDGQPIATRSWAIGQQHSTQLFGGIDALLTQAGATRGDVTVLAVATGPGSFNGTRVAVTAAKTLAFVWGVPLVGIPTLDGLAEDALHHLAPGTHLAEGVGGILALLEAGRDELYSCWYDLSRSSEAAGDLHVQPCGPITIEHIEAIGAAAPSGPIVVCGEYSAAHGDALVTALGQERLIHVNPVDAPDRAVGIGRRALLRLVAGERDDPLALEPTYVRRPNITTSTRHPIPGAS
jgi:tRNA threonylcarbamoyladenosine biosynthesis protein TsaB